MKKRIVAVTCVLMFCLGLIGCGTERADKTQQLIRGAAPGYNDGLIRVGMIQTGKESDWRDANTNDYLNTFTKERGYDLIYIDGNLPPLIFQSPYNSHSIRDIYIIRLDVHIIGSRLTFLRFTAPKRHFLQWS